MNRIKQTWLAEKLGKSYNIGQCLCPKQTAPRLKALIDMAYILDIDVKELLVSSKPEHEN